MALIKVYANTVQGKQVIESGREHMWNNEDGLTPQECFDAFGTDGHSLLVASAAAIGMVNAIVAGSEDPALPGGHTIQVNADGSVTVTS